MKKIISLIKKRLRTNKFVREAVFFTKKSTLKLFSMITKTDKEMVIFDAFLGKSYACNPRAIYEQMLEDDKFENFKFIWVTRKNSNIDIEKGQKVAYGSVKYLYYLAKAKYWVFNSKMPPYVSKKKDQVYLQTWHGTPLKKLARDIEIGEDATFYRSKMSRDDMINSYDVDVEKYNYLISPNKYSTEKFMSAFNINKERIIETGYPRNDILTNYTKEKVNEIKNRLNIDKNKKVILYAPTWRDNSFNEKGYEFVPKVDFAKWKKELGSDYVVIYKPHYLITNDVNCEGLDDFVVKSKATDSINDLFIISDILITDYSSVFFDYAILKRPMLFYMFDLKEYEEELRGFYFDINDLPGPIIQDEEELIKDIKNIDEITKVYKDKFKTFYSDVCSLEDGKASERVIEKVFK